MISALINGLIFDGKHTLTDHCVIIKDKLIKAIIPQLDLPNDIEQTFDLKGQYIVPGFIDIQVNGGGGVLFNNQPTLDSLKAIAQAHRKYGTTALLPTLITDDYQTMSKAINAVEQALTTEVPGIIGIHLEGPFLSKAKKGAHDANKICPIDAQGFDLATSLKQGKTLLTLAPEQTDKNIIRKLVNEGLIVFAGHSSANYQEALEGVDAGITGFTHLYNAMTALQSREPGMVGAALTTDDTFFGIIADGFHMHPAAFKVAIKAKYTGGAVLVTDAMATVGADSNSFILNGETIIEENGRCANAAGSLAGSALNMNNAVKNAIKFANIGWQEAVRMASLYPAKAIGLDHKLGRIKHNYKANLTILNKNLDVTATWIDGNYAKATNTLLS